MNRSGPGDIDRSCDSVLTSAIIKLQKQMNEMGVEVPGHLCEESSFGGTRNFLLIKLATRYVSLHLYHKKMGGATKAMAVSV